MSDDAARERGPESVQPLASHVAQLRPGHARLLAACDVLLRDPQLATPDALDSACDYFLSFGPNEIRERLTRILPVSRDAAAHFVLALLHASALNGDALPVGEYLDDETARQCGFSGLAFLQRVQRALRGFEGTVRELVGSSPQMVALRSRLWELCFGDHLAHLERVEPTLARRHVLVLGEAGTGHDAVAAVLLASRLGGDVRVVPELGELSAGAQSALVIALARDAPLPRVVATSSQSLPERVSAGALQPALFTRLCEEFLVLPSLRERPGDVPAIGMHFAERLLQGSVTGRRPLADAIAAWLERVADQPWPGNLPQLESALRFFVVNRRPP